MKSSVFAFGLAAVVTLVLAACTIVDGRYVRVRVPEENQQLPGSERVAKPGDASPQTPYGNAPLPPPGAPGEVGAEQPLPLEYRDAFKTGS